jgi:hypothetical protein
MTVWLAGGVVIAGGVFTVNTNGGLVTEPAALVTTHVKTKPFWLPVVGPVE